METAISTKIDYETKEAFESICKKMGSNVSVEMRRMIIGLIKENTE